MSNSPITNTATTTNSTPPTFTKQNHNHNAGWAKDIFSDVAVVRPSTPPPTSPPQQSYPTFLFLSGNGAEDPSATSPTSLTILGGSSFTAQTTHAFTKIRNILHAHDATFHNVVRMTVYVLDAQSNIQEYFRIQKEFLGHAPRPPSTFLEVKGLAVPEMVVEVEVTAVVGVRCLGVVGGV